MLTTFMIRPLMAAAGISLLAACTQLSAERIVEVAQSPSVEVVAPQQERQPQTQPVIPASEKPDYALAYAEVDDGEFRWPAINYTAVDPDYLRQEVDYATDEPPGSIVVETEKKFLYLVLKDGRAIRYGVSLGAQGRAWKGRAIIQWKRKFPTWTPTPSMIKRNPKLEQWKQGMQPGVNNPLGARALYIFQDGEDTLYRIHGSPEWQSIGKNASSGCVRMFNQDVIDLYERVKGKAPLLVK
ncbi:L,D-transpeptidase [Rhizobium sp. BK538]|uniref:L,D-transpeptidase n=1 Tax=Rhizobium sp. BK538 TaxID=2586984 RepID=UPI0018071EC2|nr:L,D-transpeptidase [Rhizobium sp. BK538]MBB4166501.1 lipoprotein-anchoring transpeptidase ErfK/SrfK [Rhizobium sp. BK538]